MKQQVFEYYDNKLSFEKLQQLLDAGWMVKFATAMSVSTGSTYHLTGKIVYILEKEL